MQRSADALGLLAEWALATKEASGEGGREGRFEVVVHVDAEVLAEDAPVGRCELGQGGRLSAETVRRLACSSPGVRVGHGDESEESASGGAGRRTRRISTKLWRALCSRDGTCRYPGCGARRGLVAHHVTHWARGGETKLNNIALLCKSHHYLVHEGGFRAVGSVGERGEDELRFFTPEGQEIAASPARGPVEGVGLEEQHRELGLSIGAETGLTRWAGERMDYDWALVGLLGRAGRKRAGTRSAEDGA